jgi:NAD-dependent protein deacetylases, SIR2 family
MDDYRESESVFNPKFSRLLDLIRKSRKIAVFTGAGVSTLSGIPDFRGAHGVYNSPWQGMNVEDIISIDFFHEEPEIFYKWAEEVWYHLEDYQPNIVHTALAKMEAKGLLSTGVFTQNIDFLHQRAGSKLVYELHGSAKHSYCTTCNAFYEYDEVAPIVRRGEVPRCRQCGGVIKPDIVFYGEPLNGTVLKAAEAAFTQADLTFILGSSLTVYPAAALPTLTLSRGGKIVIVNAQSTNADRYAELLFSDLGQVFKALDFALDLF